MAVWGGLTNSCEKKRSEKQRRKERYKHLNAEFQRITKRYKKVNNSKKWRKTVEGERLEISSRKLEIPRNISRKDGLDKGQKWYGPNRSRRY